LPASVALFLSINRFERKKHVGLAIRALALLINKLKAKNKAIDVRLVVAGGYDSRVVENVEHQLELANEAQKLGLTHSLFPNTDGQVLI
jgi:alpha-1,3/alpha-1,6-mannosyltransferase